jgi:hypothetical protein
MFLDAAELIATDIDAHEANASVAASLDVVSRLGASDAISGLPIRPRLPGI